MHLRSAFAKCAGDKGARREACPHGWAPSTAPTRASPRRRSSGRSPSTSWPLTVCSRCTSGDSGSRPSPAGPPAARARYHGSSEARGVPDGQAGLHRHGRHVRCPRQDHPARQPPHPRRRRRARGPVRPLHRPQPAGRSPRAPRAPVRLPRRLRRGSARLRRSVGPDRPRGPHRQAPSSARSTQTSAASASPSTSSPRRASSPRARTCRSTTWSR